MKPKPRVDGFFSSESTLLPMKESRETYDGVDVQASPERIAELVGKRLLVGLSVILALDDPKVIPVVLEGEGV